VSELTVDVCKLDYPPASYGDTLAGVERTVQDVVERVFRDPSGILRSGVDGGTMKIRTLADIKDRPHAIGCYSENSAIPRELKPLWLNYENAIQASGKYLVALGEKYKATHDAEVAALARRTFESLETLWNNAAEQNAWGRGWMPKPYGGIEDVSQCFETSEDQYGDLVLGLQAYHETVANETERTTIEDMVASFAEWWYERDYAGAYFGRGIWWKRLGFPHPVAGFLHINALAHAWRPDPRFEDGFETWIKLTHGFYPSLEHLGPNGCGLVLEALERLYALRPEHSDVWDEAAVFMGDRLIVNVKEDNCQPHLKGRTQAATYSALYLSMAHKLLPNRGYDKWTLHCLEACMGRADFYHVCRGQPIADLEFQLAGDDYRDTFWCEGHVSWLGGYWRLVNAGVLEHLQ
jgi:hypothetical protein